MNLFDKNKNTDYILNSLNDNIVHFMKPILENYNEELSIANEINSLLERLPKYKQLLEKYNLLLEKYQMIEKENCILRENFKTNHGFWYNNIDQIRINIIDNVSGENKSNDNSYNHITEIYKSLNKIINTMSVEKNEDIKDNNECEEEDDEKNQEDEYEEEEDEKNQEDEDECEEEENVNDDESDIEVFEKIIGNTKYYVSHSDNGDIYEYIDNDIVGKKIGILKNGMAHL